MSQKTKNKSDAIENFSAEERISWLRLIRSENVGFKTFYNLINLYGTASRALEEASELSLRGGRQKPIKILSRGEAEDEIAKCEKIGARMIARPENTYPARLREISDAPPVITVLGNTSILNNEKSIAIVGARNASANGCRFAYKIAQELGEKGFVVVSGLARGIDTSAHKGSLEKGTIAVIAGGIDHIYPPENEGLYRKIAEDGAIIAELPFGSAPTAQHFPQRNRIISGMTLGTVVVEASMRSGSLITAKFALEHGREVFAVPGSPLDPRAEGPNKLIKQGAILVESSEDITSNLSQIVGRQREMDFHGVFEEGPVEDNIIPHPAVKTSGTELEEARKIVRELLGTTPVQTEDLITSSGMPARLVQIVLLELELAGTLSRHPGNKVSLLGHCS